MCDGTFVTAKNKYSPSPRPMIGNASRIPTPRKKNVKMFGRASGWRAIASTAFDATIPSPIAEPNATAATISEKPITIIARIKGSEGTLFEPFLMFLGRRQGEIDDGEEGEHERLQRADEEVEELQAE